MILILTYNNERYARANLLSALRQKYPYYRIVLCNDASTDDTQRIIEQAIHSRDAHDRVHMCENSARKGALCNIYECIHRYVHDDEIVVMLDGDDELAHDKVLSYLADVYRDGTIWLTYGQYRSKKKAVLGRSCAVSEKVWQQGSLRQNQKYFTASHLRTFYGWLFKRIDKQDLMYEGKFYAMSYDVAIMMPMLEMARYHYRFIPEVLYIYNDDNPISDHQVNWPLQRKMADHILQRPSYAPLAS